MLLTCIHFKIGSLLFIKANVGKVELGEMLKKLGNVEKFFNIDVFHDKRNWTRNFSSNIIPPGFQYCFCPRKTQDKKQLQSSFLQYPVLKLVIKVMSVLENYLYMNINCKFTISQPLGEEDRCPVGISA